MAETHLLGPLGHAQGREEMEKNAINQFMGILPGIIGIHEKSPLNRRPRVCTRNRLVSFLGFLYCSHRIRTRPPVRLGTVRAGSGATRAGVYLGSLLLSTPS